MLHAYNHVSAIFCVLIGGAAVTIFNSYSTAVERSCTEYCDSTSFDNGDVLSMWHPKINVTWLFLKLLAARSNYTVS